MDSYEVQIAVKFCDSLNKLLGGKGKNLWITAPFYVDYGNNIYFGNNCEVSTAIVNAFETEALMVLNLIAGI